jgi:twinkle protein
MSWRGISARTLEFYKSPVLVNEEGKPVEVHFRYPHATKVRPFEGKAFRSLGEMSKPQLFGQDLFPAGSARAITVYEGEPDALTGFELLGKYPSVSVRSSGSAKADCSANYDYLNSFEQIYLCFDNDGPGQEAVKQVANLFDFNKVFHVKLDKYKDANDFLQNGEGDLFRKLWYNAKRFLPDNIVSAYSEIDQILEEKVADAHAPYPFQRLQDMTYGMRPGEAILIKALEGIGKTEIMRAFEYKALIETDHNIGIIHLEEPKDRSIKGLVGYHMGMPVHLPDSMVDLKVIKEKYRELTRRDNRVHFYKHFGSSDPDDILGAIRFLGGACGCKLIFLDHISIVVSGIENEDERKKLDYISTQLKMMAEALGFTLVYVSHVNDDGLTRGSRNISKVADLVLMLNRNLTSADPVERNTTFVTVEKNRFSGRTGPAGKLVFNPETYMLAEEGENFGLPPEKAA